MKLDVEANILKPDMGAGKKKLDTAGASTPKFDMGANTWMPDSGAGKMTLDMGASKPKLDMGANMILPGMGAVNPQPDKQQHPNGLLPQCT